METKDLKRSKNTVPDPSELTLYLLREELKSRKFFSGLQKLGLDYCFYHPHLDKPILAAVGFGDPSDEVYEFYFKLIEKRSRKIREDEESITKQARKVWKALVGYQVPDARCRTARFAPDE